MYKKILIFSLFISGIFAVDDKKKISEALGHMIGKNLESLEWPVDFTALVKGIEDEAAGRSSPLSDEECVQALTNFCQEKLKEKAVENLEKATDFLNNNKCQEGIVCLAEGQLQYKVLKEGTGQSVQAYNSPLVRCKGYFLGGEFFESGYEPQVISLEDAIPGLSQGIVGMCEEEVRTLYIHPKLGYENQQHLNPNSLLIFEIEIIKADASSETHTASDREMIPFLKNLQ